MIYIKNTHKSQGIVLPVSVTADGAQGAFRFFMVNTVNLSTDIAAYLRTNDFNADFNMDFAHLPEPIMSAGGQFYNFTLDLPRDFQGGTYEYALMLGDRILSQGVAQVGDFENNDEQYNKDLQYEQYNF